MKDLKTAILIFANSAEYEATRKPFLYSKEVFESLNEHTLQLVKKTNLPYFLVTEKEQRGSSFGERFINAIQSVYDVGFDSLIIIGNDTPHLTTSKLVKVNQELYNTDIVLGSATDGGFYLLGIKKEHFDANLFLKLPWQKQNLATVLTKLFISNSISVSSLEVLSDIDNLKDVNAFINCFKKVYANLYHLLLQIRIRNAIISTSVFEKFFFLYQSTAYNKGSPI
ncbi:DUF2064 domain-containing protein [Flavobacterium jejuense]|uniref:DUF2064 domain-containing protein n=1 Tax=Flavobacterium jejuense TaxID=1544455 RepID=A0ABX0IXI4_9FLAO|nr:DUF2064 domain-containing protein [Flavobacterium jejuense]NHN27238.1 DUF2064 domain-containing protein [Flavobacterium jejuense]